MISRSGHLACRVIDGIVRRLLILNLGSNLVLVLVLVLGFRLYSTQEHTRHEIKQDAMRRKITGCMTDALWKQNRCTMEAQKVYIGSTVLQHNNMHQAKCFKT